MDRIHKRNWASESDNITSEYIEKLEYYYERFFNKLS